MLLVNRAVATPNACGLCGNRDGAMIDTQVDAVLTSVSGRLYICRKFCVPKICELTGALNPEAAKALKAEVGELRLENDVAGETIRRQRVIVAAVAAAGKMVADEELVASA